MKRTRAFTHIDDLQRASIYKDLLAPDGPAYRDMSLLQQGYARMLFFMVWPDRGGFDHYDAGLQRLRANPAVVEEISQILAVTTETINHIPGRTFKSLGLSTHTHYRREEALAAIRFADLTRSAKGQAGGVTWSPDGKIAALFVNFHKSEGEFTPSTMYRDFPISRDIFHWESPNNTSVDSPIGQRYIQQRETGRSVLLFVRDRPTGPLGANPFLFLGPVDYVSHEGERPIAITWRLRRPMPADTFASGSVVAS